MNFKKRATTIALVSVLSSMSLFASVYADNPSNLESDSNIPTFDLESNGNQSFSTTKNEYEMIKELRNKSNIELKSLGYSNNHIQDLNNYEENFKSHIEELNLLSNDQLKNFDYTNDQINMIRNFNGTESEITPLAASVTNTISKNSSTSTSSKSTLNVKIRFSWSGVPTFQFNDMYAVVNGEKMYFDNESTLFTTTYVGSNGSQKTYTGYLKRTGAGNTGADTKFPVYRNEVIKYYIKSGSANVGMNRSGKVTQCGIGTSYGHSTISAGISVSYPAGVSISFNTGVNSTYKSSVFSL